MISVLRRHYTSSCVLVLVPFSQDVTCVTFHKSQNVKHSTRCEKSQAVWRSTCRHNVNLMLINNFVADSLGIKTTGYDFDCTVAGADCRTWNNPKNADERSVRGLLWFMRGLNTGFTAEKTNIQSLPCIADYTRCAKNRINPIWHISCTSCAQDTFSKTCVG